MRQFFAIFTPNYPAAMLKKLFLFIFIIFFLGAAGLCGTLYYWVVLEPGEEIREENIRQILGRESEVYYSDGVTKLGVFFDTAHRQYVAYSDIPKDFVNALVAAEDDIFFNHFGFDPAGIVRAMIKNFQAGRVVQGGSTLTQQTAKNLFKRTERSYEAKLKELLYALRLEYHYTKEQIFEFYSNQFYVSGNGHGLGVAARYYFDKKPEELNLVECAFIAGSVKRPNYYNPFIKRSEEAAETAKQRANTRLKYVLGEMLKAGMIDTSVHNESVNSGVQFNKGQVGFALDYAMELVRDAVSSSQVRQGLLEHDIANIATSGVKVITTIDKKIQLQSLASLRSELSRLDVRLRGYERKEVQEESKQLKYKGDAKLQQGAFIFGTIESIEGKGENIKMRVRLDNKLGEGIVDSKGLERLVRAFVKYKKNRWAEPKKNDQATFVKQFEVGDRVWVRVTEVSGDGSGIALQLEKYPKVQGGAVVVQQGRIMGVAGGTENRFFNRAMYAKRTMGSAFKPLVFTAALQLGWNSSDMLKNKRELFVYQGQPYFPRPDHVSPHEWISMSWAGVYSENVASVWLLANLCEKLNTIQFREVAEKVGLVPKEVDGQKEPYRTYRARIRDKFGIQVNRSILREAAYRSAVKNLETDFIFDGLVEEYGQLKELHYGLNYEKYRENLDKDIAKKIKAKGNLSKRENGEYWLRKSLLRNHYLLIEATNKQLDEYRKRLAEADEFQWLDRYEFDTLGTLFTDETTGIFSFYAPGKRPQDLTPVDPNDLRNYFTNLDDIEQTRFWYSVKINGLLSVETFAKVSGQVEHEYQKLMEQLPYNFEVLAQVPDFRVMVGLFYVRSLAGELGIRSKLEPVLSFPLGSNVVSLFEATRMYEALVTGHVHTLGTDKDEESTDSLAIIDRIEDANGEVVYVPELKSRQVVDDSTRLSIGHVLENIVKFGTGKLANKRVKLLVTESQEETDTEMDLIVPLLGKTGTANNYTNATFLGYLPGVTENGAAMNLEDGYAVGVYVGYDDNKSMRRKGSRISGSAGALPTWCDIVNALLAEQKYNSKLDPVDLSFYGLAIKRQELGQLNGSVDITAGATFAQPFALVSDLNRNHPSIMTFGKKTKTGRFLPKRNYHPYWRSLKR